MVQGDDQWETGNALSGMVLEKYKYRAGSGWVLAESFCFCRNG
jgi:hypothetical protein